MINVISKVTYAAGNKAMEVAEWLFNSSGDKPAREYARIQRLKSSAIRVKRSAVKGRIIMSYLGNVLSSNKYSHRGILREGGDL
jgi:hypothetical protein